MKNNYPNKEPQSGSFLSFVIEFVRFATGFAVIVAVALFALHFASAAM